MGWVPARGPPTLTNKHASEPDFRFKFVDWLEVKAELELELAIQPNFLITLREVLPNLWVNKIYSFCNCLIKQFRLKL